MPYKDKEKLYAYQVQRWINRKIAAVKYKGGCCVNCGYSKYYGALDFHHRVPTEKDVDWSKLRLASWEKIKSELDKCKSTSLLRVTQTKVLRLMLR